MEKTIEFLKTGTKNVLMAMTFGGYHLYVIQREHDQIIQQMKIQNELEAQKRDLARVERREEDARRAAEHEKRMKELDEKLNRHWWQRATKTE